MQKREKPGNSDPLEHVSAFPGTPAQRIVHCTGQLLPFYNSSSFPQAERRGMSGTAQDKSAVTCQSSCMTLTAAGDQVYFGVTEMIQLLKWLWEWSPTILGWQIPSLQPLSDPLEVVKWSVQNRTGISESLPQGLRALHSWKPDSRDPIWQPQVCPLYRLSLCWALKKQFKITPALTSHIPPSKRIPSVQFPTDSCLFDCPQPFFLLLVGKMKCFWKRLSIIMERSPCSQ